MENEFKLKEKVWKEIAERENITMEQAINKYTKNGKKNNS